MVDLNFLDNTFQDTRTDIVESPWKKKKKRKKKVKRPQQRVLKGKAVKVIMT